MGNSESEKVIGTYVKNDNLGPKDFVMAVACSHMVLNVFDGVTTEASDQCVPNMAHSL